MSEPITFKHSGEIGDTVYSMPVMRALANGRPAKLLIGQSHLTRVRNRGQQQRIVDLIKPLLLAIHPWISDVAVHRGELVRYNLDRWRWMPASYSRLTRTLAECHAMAFGMGMELFKHPWITLSPDSDPEYRKAIVHPVVIHRSPRYHNQWFPWRAILDHYAGQIVMCGMKEEHEAFCKEFSVEIPHVHTKNFLELAVLINASRIFIGNQSSPFALAEALKKPVIQEVCLAIHDDGAPNCIFKRRWAQHVATCNWNPWDLASLPEHDSEEPTYARRPVTVGRLIHPEEPTYARRPVTVGRLIHPEEPTYARRPVTVGRLIHLVARYDPTDPDTQRRIGVAEKSWEMAYQNSIWKPLHVRPSLRANDKMQEVRGCPYLKDVLDMALREAQDNDIIVLTNDDAIFHSTLASKLQEFMAGKPCCAAFRVAFEGQCPDLSIPLSGVQSVSDPLHASSLLIDGGRDLFAMRPEWLRRNWVNIPDYLVGNTDWDAILAMLMRTSQSLPATVSEPDPAVEMQHGVILHETHDPKWAVNRASPENEYNRRLTKEWIARNGVTGFEGG